MNTIQDELHDAARRVRDFRISDPPSFAGVERAARRRHLASASTLLALVALVAVVCGLVVWRARDGDSSTLDIVNDPNTQATLTRTPFGDSGWELLWLPDGYQVDSAKDDEIVAKAANDIALRISLEQGTVVGGTPIVQWPLSNTVETADGARRTEANTIITVRAPALSLPERLRVIHSVAPTERANPIKTTGEFAEVPDVRNIDYLDATQRLAAIGLRARWLVDTGASAAAGIVTDQTPRQGETVSAGSFVAIAVAAPSLPNPQQRLREDQYVGVAGSEDPFDNRSYPAGVAAAIHMIPGVTGPPPNSIIPVVFLRGELVGYLGFGGSFIPLDKLTDPTWKPVERSPVAVGGTGPPVAATREFGDVTVVEYHGLRVEMPTGWRLGNCPGDKVVMLDPQPLPCPGPMAGTWLTLAPLDPTEPEIFDCLPAFFDGLDACQVWRTFESRNGTKPVEDRYARGYDVRISYFYGGGGGGSNDRPIVVDPKVSRDQTRMGESPEPAVRAWADGQKLDLLDVRSGQYQSYALTRSPGGADRTVYELTMSYVFSPRTRTGEWRVTAQKRLDEPWPPAALAPRR